MQAGELYTCGVHLKQGERALLKRRGSSRIQPNLSRQWGTHSESSGALKRAAGAGVQHGVLACGMAVLRLAELA